MKTKHRILSVLAIMAILAGLCLAMVSTVSAGTLTIVNAKAAPATVNSTSSWEVDVTVPTPVTPAYIAGDVLTVTFPTGVTMPATVSNSYVTVDGVAFITGDLGCSVSGQALLITINGAMATAMNDGSFNVVVAPAAGIKNPAIAKPIVSNAYLLKVKSNKDAEVSKAVGFIPVYSSSPAAGNRYTGITVTGQGWTPSSAISVTGTIAGNGTSDATGSFTLTAYYTDAGHKALVDLSAYGMTGKEIFVTDGAGQTQSKAVFNSTQYNWNDATNGNAGAESVLQPTFTLKPNIAVTPGSGDVTSSVTVKGTDFTGAATPNTILAITIGGVNVTPATPITLSTIDGLGTNDDFVATVMVPQKNASGAPMSTGVQIVTATDSAGASGSGNFTINPPTVTITPASGGPGTVVTLNGTNFAAGDTISQIDFGNKAKWPTGTTTNVAVVNGSGTWTYSGKVLADAPEGYNIILITTVGGTKTGTYFSVGTRSLAITPTSGPLGTTVVLTGSNMDVPAAGSSDAYQILAANLKIMVNGVKTAWPVNMINSPWTGTPIEIDTNGSIKATTLQIPGTDTTGFGSIVTSGVLAIEATDNKVTTPTVTGAVATGAFTVVRPVMTISPNTGVIGTTITVVGSGFVAGDDVVIYFAKLGATGSTRMARPVADANGAITATFAVPYNAGLALGDTCIITTDDSYGNSVDQKTFTVSSGTLSVSPATAKGGDVVTVSGVGLVPGTKITVMSIDGWDVTPDKLPQVAIDGTVTASFAIPAFIQIGVKVVDVTIHNASTGNDSTYTNFVTVTAGGGTTGNSVTERLAAIDGEFDQVWTLDAGTWKLFDPSDVANAEFTTLTPGMAIYIHTTQAVDNVSLGGVVRNLVSGWNMIGWVS